MAINSAEPKTDKKDVVVSVSEIDLERGDKNRDLEAQIPHQTTQVFKQQQDQSRDTASTTDSTVTDLKEASPEPPTSRHIKFSPWNPKTWSRKMLLLVVGLFLLTVGIVPAVAVPVILEKHSAIPAVDVDDSDAQFLGGGLPLRIMPLGASITWGQRSTDGNGYRNDLRAIVVSGGNVVNMVGSQKHGQMVDNDNEGWPGYVVDQVHAKANASVPAARPNLILVNAGTNDCLQNKDVAHAADRMESMVRDLLAWSPRATVVLSTLIVNVDAATEQRVQQVNDEYRALVAALAASGLPVVLAEMHGSNGPQLADMADQTHPNDQGYAKMATIWYKALVEADGKGFIQEAEPVAGIPDNGGP